MWRLPRPPIVFWIFGIFVGIVTLLLTGIIFDIAQVLGLIFVFIFFGNLSGIDLSGWMASSMTSMTFVFLGGLGLRLTCISRRRIVGLSLVSIPMLLINLIFVFLDWRPITFWAPGVNLSLKGDCRLTFSFVLTVFSIISSYASRLCPQLSN